MTPPIVIKKYGNRRLYDTGDSKYVTLDELAAKIRGGAELRVVDAQTNDDLTQATLTQIVLETGHAARFLPVQLLTQMIRLSDDALAEFFSRYVTNALEIYLQAKRGMQSLSAYSPLAQLPVAARDALTRMWMGAPFGYQPGAYEQPAPPYGGMAPPYVAPPPPPYVAPPPPPYVAPPPPPEGESEPPPNGERDVAAMRRELDELKQLIRDNAAPRPPRPRKKRKS